MSDTQDRSSSPFSRGAVLAVVLVGFLSFVSMLYFIGVGDTGDQERSGAAHASANGLNGYSGLVRLLEAEGYEIERSRGLDRLETTNLLILTPPEFTDPNELAEVLNDRQFYGPTIVILPKWFTVTPGFDVPEEDRERVKDDWVRLAGAQPLGWTQNLPDPYSFTHEMEMLDEGQRASWRGLNLTGMLPTEYVTYVEQSGRIDPVVTGAGGRALAFYLTNFSDYEYYDDLHTPLFIVEPDLVNNYGLADGQRAALALALVRDAGYGEGTAITIDMTFNGYGDSTNLLTLAFQPPFLAATLCLILAMLIIGWRAFLRFGPTAASAQEIAFGKRRLVSNGAGLVVRARRLGLLAEPYINLTERRLGKALGLVKPDAESIDQALAIRLPEEEPFSLRAARLHNADKPIEILRAAQALNELTGKLTK